MSKEYINSERLLEDSFRLGFKVLESGFEPNFIVGVWRGGTPVGIAIQELFEYKGIQTDHISIRTSSYEGIDKRAKYIKVHGLDYIVKKINSEDKLLIIDDVYDSGLSIDAVLEKLLGRARKNYPEVRIATPYYKPENNKTDRVPDYYLYETDKWLVFPHELKGLTEEEIIQNKPVMRKVLEDKK